MSSSIGRCLSDASMDRTSFRIPVLEARMSIVGRSSRSGTYAIYG